MATIDAELRTIAAIRAGDVAELRRLLGENPGLAAMRLVVSGGGRTPLHIVADWPGYFPNGPEIARMLIEAGANLDARGNDDGSGETPLHWTASNDDVEVAAVLIEAGADLDAADGSIGTPVANAVGYGCWNVARLLVTHGAKVDALWIAAALGMIGRIEELLGDPEVASPDMISQAFWHACAGHQRRAAEMLLGRGARIDWVPDYASGTPLDAAQGQSTQQQNVIEWLQGLGASRADDENRESG